jgi:serine/threonine-protein kinase RsbW
VKGETSDHAQTVSLNIPAKPQYLALCRLALHGVATCAAVDAPTLRELKLALTEACTNSIIHGYRGGQGSIDVSLTFSGSQLVVVVEDAGAGFWSMAPTPDVDFNGGMGLMLIHELTDGFEVGPGTDGRGTRLTFTKQLGGWVRPELGGTRTGNHSQ